MLYGLDLFTGIGGLTLALQDWVTPIAYCEREPYVVAWLLESMRLGKIPTAPICTDIRELRGDMCRGVDIVYGGFPCQDVSVAGARKGLDGERTGLFWELHRIVKESKPKFVFLENVPGLRTKGAIDVARALASIGYDCRWTIVSAAEVGAAFIGKRWFLLAAANCETLRLKQGRRSRAYRQEKDVDSPNGYTRLTPWSPERGFESRVFRTGDGIPFAVDRDKALGNAVVPAQGREAFKRLCGLND